MLRGRGRRGRRGKREKERRKVNKHVTRVSSHSIKSGSPLPRGCTVRGKQERKMGKWEEGKAGKGEERGAEQPATPSCEWDKFTVPARVVTQPPPSLPLCVSRCSFISVSPSNHPTKSLHLLFGIYTLIHIQTYICMHPWHI